MTKKNHKKKTKQSRRSLQAQLIYNIVKLEIKKKADVLLKKKLNKKYTLIYLRGKNSKKSQGRLSTDACLLKALSTTMRSQADYSQTMPLH